MNPTGQSKTTRAGAGEIAWQKGGTYQDQIVPLAGCQERMIILVGRHLLQDDACCPGELDEAPLVVPTLRILLPGLPRQFRGAQPMLEVLVGIPKVFARLVGKLSDGRRAGLPL